jgi:hypothetical protein
MSLQSPKLHLNLTLRGSLKNIQVHEDKVCILETYHVYGERVHTAGDTVDEHFCRSSS